MVMVMVVQVECGVTVCIGVVCVCIAVVGNALVDNAHALGLARLSNGCGLISWWCARFWSDMLCWAGLG